jgi:hypothetical protein
MATRLEPQLTFPEVNASVSIRFLLRLVTANPREACADGRKLQVALAVFFKVPLPSVEFVSNLCRIWVCHRISVNGVGHACSALLSSFGKFRGRIA